jgi:hypothetical protein
LRVRGLAYSYAWSGFLGTKRKRAQAFGWERKMYSREIEKGREIEVRESKKKEDIRVME